MRRETSKFLRCAAIGLALALPSGLDAAEADEVPLAAHRAIYDLALNASRGKQSMQSANGRILYDFTGNMCDGYALSFRQVTELDSGEGKRVTSDLRTTNWEDGQGKSFRFVTKNFLNGEPADDAEGKAERTEAGVIVSITRPAPKKADLGPAVFPSDHMRRIIVAARAGQSLLEVGTYDGAENGEKVYNSLTVIGKAIAPGERAPTDAAAGKPALEKLTRWPVTISYFDRAKAGGDQTPAYAMSFELYENGIARAIRIDYGDFILDGRLSSLDIPDAKPCK